MAVVSQREAARQLGVTHTALQRAAKDGRISQEPGGGWDVERTRAALGATSNPIGRTAAMARPDAPARNVAQPDANPTPAIPGNTNFHNARTANEMLKAQDRKLRLDERRGILVDKARALTLVHRLAKEERDAVLAWPARVAPELAAELGVDPHRLHTLLDARLRQYLAERSSVRIEVV